MKFFDMEVTRRAVCDGCRKRTWNNFRLRNSGRITKRYGRWMANYIVTVLGLLFGFAMDIGDVMVNATCASVLIGIGVDRERFIEHFGPLGRIAFVPQGGEPCTP